MLLTAQLFSLFAFLDYLVFFSIWLFCRYLRLLECYSSITRVTVTRVMITRVTLFSLLYSVTRVTLFPLLYSKFRVTLFVTRAQLWVKHRCILDMNQRGGGTEAQLLPEKQKTMRRPYLTLSKMAKKPFFLMNK